MRRCDMEDGVEKVVDRYGYAVAYLLHMNGSALMVPDMESARKSLARDPYEKEEYDV
jgi:hypothetical protein